MIIVYRPLFSQSEPARLLAGDKAAAAALLEREGLELVSGTGVRWVATSEAAEGQLSPDCEWASNFDPWMFSFKKIDIKRLFLFSVGSRLHAA